MAKGNNIFFILIKNNFLGSECIVIEVQKKECIKEIRILSNGSLKFNGKTDENKPFFCDDYELKEKMENGEITIGRESRSKNKADIWLYYEKDRNSEYDEKIEPIHFMLKAEKCNLNFSFFENKFKL